MKSEKISLIANAVLFLLLLTAIVYAFVQQAEAKRQTEAAVANTKHTIEASMEADLCKREAAALQDEVAKQGELAEQQLRELAQALHEAAKQRELAEQHLRELEQALARCKGK